MNTCNLTIYDFFNPILIYDLFHVFVQGAIQGPGEFAEGLARGVQSLLGHTVGKFNYFDQILPFSIS